MYEVSFKGNGYTGADTISKYIKRRCAELTLSNGYTHYVIVGAGDDTSHSINKDPYGNVNMVTRRGEKVVIKMLNNPDNSTTAYDAKMIMASAVD
jgi:hypothetical protein